MSSGRSAAGETFPFEARRKQVDPEFGSALDYARKKYREKTGKDLDIGAGGPASGGEAPPKSVAVAEKRGELADETGSSPYKAAALTPKPKFDEAQWKAAVASYVADAERGYEEDEREQAVSPLMFPAERSRTTLAPVDTTQSRGSRGIRSFSRPVGLLAVALSASWAAG